MKAAPVSVVVSNPSSNPEMMRAAAALADAGMLRSYCVPIAIGPRELALAGRLPGSLAARVLRQLRRRAVPPGIPLDSVDRVAALSDARQTFVGRCSTTSGRLTRVTLSHARTFDRRVARRLRHGDDAVIGVVGSTLHTQRRAGQLDIPVTVDSAMPDVRRLRSLLREEAGRVPAYASTLLVHDWPDEFVDGCEQELDRAHRIVAPSSYVVRSLQDAGIDSARIVKVPLGVDTELFRPRTRDDDAVFRVIFVGQVSQWKGISYLLDAFRQAAIPSSELLLVGAIRGTAAAWIGQPGVRHLPTVPREELPGLYAGADVFVMPSLGDAFCLTALEAMAMGLPVIVSEHTFGRDIVDDGANGFVVPIRDVDAISERLLALARDPDLRAQLGRAARIRAEGYSWHAFGERLVSIMKGSAEGARPETSRAV